MEKFDPNAAALSDGIFGLPTTEKNAKLVFLPVPWEATTSYGGGTSNGPAAILEASYQVDLFDLEVERPYEAGFFIKPENKKFKIWNKQAKTAAQKIIKVGGVIGKNKALRSALDKVNELGAKVNELVYEESKEILKSGKILALIGGDHSTPFGAIQAAQEKFPAMGILHIDAHSDTRKAYEGFEWSHASIMYNVMENLPVKKLVQVGIRDFCEEEFEYVKQPKIKTYFDLDLQKRKMKGETWSSLAKEIIEQLPQDVWISFDIDGLEPRFCPNTGTPVPGGLDYPEALVLMAEVVHSGRRIVGFDLNEVSPGKDEWDANVGARLLYKMAAYTLASRKICKLI